jgi:hypothetical protein
MVRTRCLVAFLLSLSLVSLAQADGLVQQLPKDGAWATYDMESSAKGGPGGATMSMKGSVWVASVGQVTENNLPCRWIEVEFKVKMEIGDAKHEKSEVYKLLIPEKYLAKGETPLDHVVRAWTKTDKGDPRKWDKPNDIDAGPMPLILSGPWKDVKQLDKAEVESKLGKLACEGVQGSLEFKMRQEKVMKCKLENRVHPDSPFGVVTSRWTITVPEMDTNMEMTSGLKLSDFGTDAKSKMPDAK